MRSFLDNLEAEMAFRIMIVGAGGIGGYLAAKLCRVCDDMVLIARGANLTAIQKDGLTLIDCGQRTVVHPALVTDKPADAGMVDAVLLCTKGYSLNEALDSAAPCIGPKTLLVPTLNGINTHIRIAARAKSGVAADGCIYVFSRVVAPGVVEKTGEYQRFFLGIPGKSQAQSPKALLTLRDLLLKAGG